MQMISTCRGGASCRESYDESLGSLPAGWVKMNDLKQSIMDCSLEHWHRYFTGISGIAVAEHLDLPHELVLRAFDELEAEGKGTVRRGVTLYQLFISIDEPRFREEKPILTAIFFPAPEVLTENFYSSLLCRSNIPEYKARLYKGGSQVQLVYFSSDVLTKYLEHIEVYEVEDSVSGGHICRRDGSDFPLMRFGRRRLRDGTVVVTAILWDLAQLPEKEQAYWHAYEIESPCFTRDDPDFAIFYRQNFEAEFLDDNDPLRNVLAEIREINGLFGPDGLFSLRTNPYLRYPLGNTYKSFSDACSELYKLVGPDSLEIKTLKNLLTNYFNYQQQAFLHPNTGRPLGKLDLLKHLCENLGCDKLPRIIKRIKQHRINADHRVIAPHVASTNYFAEFRGLLQELYEGLREFREQVTTLTAAQDD